MNKEKILAVANAIESKSIPDLGFNMNYSFAETSFCGTVACIAGWTVALEVGVNRVNMMVDHGWYDVSNAARDMLELNQEDARDLLRFDAQPVPASEGYITLDEITAAHAVAVLRNFAETGKVDWSVGGP